MKRSNYSYTSYNPVHQSNHYSQSQAFVSLSDSRRAQNEGRHIKQSQYPDFPQYIEAQRLASETNATYNRFSKKIGTYYDALIFGRGMPSHYQDKLMKDYGQNDKGKVQKSERTKTIFDVLNQKSGDKDEDGVDVRISKVLRTLKKSKQAHQQLESAVHKLLQTKIAPLPEISQFTEQIKEIKFLIEKKHLLQFKKKLLTEKCKNAFQEIKQLQNKLHQMEKIIENENYQAEQHQLKEFGKQRLQD